MDTATHFVVGIGLGGLAMIDPAIAADPVVAAAVITGTIIGSQAPDADTLFRIKGNATYIRQHRGPSHSIPAVLAWTAGITGFLYLVFPALPIWNVAFWVFLAVGLHVFSDLFNTYGTQAMQPFHQKWISWNIIHIFDPFIFVGHLIAIAAWALGMGAPQFIFPTLYGLMIAYYVWRTITHYLLEQKLNHEPDAAGKRMAIATFHPRVWNLVESRANGTYRIGEWRGQQAYWRELMVPDAGTAVEASKSHPDIAAFLYFTKYAVPECRVFDWGYEVRWTDVRFRHRKQYPFIGVVRMDFYYQPIDAYVGWKSDLKLADRFG